jgi:hypothetical protein
MSKTEKFYKFFFIRHNTLFLYNYNSSKRLFIFNICRKINKQFYLTSFIFMLLKEDKMKKTIIIISVVLVLIVIVFAGYQFRDKLGFGQIKTYDVNKMNEKIYAITSQQLGCNSKEECDKFCEANHEACDKLCKDYPETCILRPANAGQQGPPQGVQGPPQLCRDATLLAKIKVIVDSALVNPPANISNMNWMTKILPSGNPYPGYYYDISTAFGPAIDAIIGQSWSGEGEPPIGQGFHYSFGYWDEVPKGKGATMGQETPETIDFSKYQLAVFYTNTSGSQDKMISSLPALTMTEAEAKTYFYSVFKKSFLNVDQKTLSKKNNKFYEAQWKDSEKTNDYWDVQIGEGYIAIGQGKVYSDESALAGNVGTIWMYTGCRPCDKCDTWPSTTALNKDCTTNADCKSGLSCSGGYCGTFASQAPSTIPSGTGGPPSGTGAPGSPCTSDASCSSGLTCKNSVCAAPTGGP